MGDPPDRLSPSRVNRYPDKARLGGKLAFANVYDRRVKTVRGPLVVFAAPNDVGHARLGLSISRRLGNAVVRNRLKRQLREAFRMLWQGFPSYDLVVVARPHAPLALAEYQQLLASAVSKVVTTK